MGNKKAPRAQAATIRSVRVIRSFGEHNSSKGQAMNAAQTSALMLNVLTTAAPNPSSSRTPCTRPVIPLAKPRMQSPAKSSARHGVLASRRDWLLASSGPGPFKAQQAAEVLSVCLFLVRAAVPRLAADQLVS